jgi:putative Holliday junction resolvase
MRALGLDVGDKRIGIAVSDPLRMIAGPVEVYERRGADKDTAYLAALIAARDVSVVVVGLPLKLDGTDSAQTEKTRAFAETLRGATKAEVVFADERLTTWEAEDTLIEAGVDRAGRKKLVDKVAAVILLQDWLNVKKR